MTAIETLQSNETVKQVVNSRLRLFHGESVGSGAVGSVA